ncbi:hypothetical protein Tco_0428994 [Tanacetum coccineum]
MIPTSKKSRNYDDDVWIKWKEDDGKLMVDFSLDLRFHEKKGTVKVSLRECDNDLDPRLKEIIRVGVCRCRHRKEEKRGKRWEISSDDLKMNQGPKSRYKLILMIPTWFHEKKVSGLRVNFNKSKLYGVGVDSNEVEEMSKWMKCSVGEFLFTYLGLPIGECMSRSSSWRHMVENFKKRLSDWRAKMMSFGGRLTLVKTVLGFVREVVVGFKKEGDSLLVKVIKSIYGANSGLVKGSGGGKGTGNIGVWGDIIKNGGWDCVRELRGRACGDVEDILGVLTNVVISNECRDLWRWSIHESGSFTVRVLTKMVEERTLGSDSQETIWIKLMPKKVKHLCVERFDSRAIIFEVIMAGGDLVYRFISTASPHVVVQVSTSLGAIVLCVVVVKLVLYGLRFSSFVGSVAISHLFCCEYCLGIYYSVSIVRAGVGHAPPPQSTFPNLHAF